MAEQKGKSHKLTRSKHNKSKYDRQWYRTAQNKLKRINYQRKLAHLPPLKGMSFKGKAGDIYVTA